MERSGYPYIKVDVKRNKVVFGTLKRVRQGNYEIDNNYSGRGGWLSNWTRHVNWFALALVKGPN